MTFDQCPDVMTDRDLALLLQVATSWPRRQRDRAKVAGVAPNLPAMVPGLAPLVRYRKSDVAAWLASGSSRRVQPAMRRVS